jgi:hypothetical protein
VLAIFKKLSLACAAYVSTYMSEIPHKMKEAAYAKKSSLKMVKSKGRNMSEH